MIHDISDEEGGSDLDMSGDDLSVQVDNLLGTNNQSSSDTNVSDQISG